MSKNEILEMVKAFVMENAENAEVLRDFRAGLKDAVKMEKGDGRKEQVLALLKEHGKMTISEIAGALNTSTKNASSQLCYLRRDGVKIATSSDGRKFIEE